MGDEERSKLEVNLDVADGAGASGSREGGEDVGKVRTKQSGVGAVLRDGSGVMARSETSDSVQIIGDVLR